MEEWERQRLERLERRQRQWFVVVIAAAALLLLAAAAEPQATELRVRRLVIVDEQGRDRIVLRTSGKEASLAEVALLDDAGTDRVVLATSALDKVGMASISLHGPDGAIRWMATNDNLSRKGGVSMTWHNAKGGIPLGISESGDGVMMIGRGRFMGERRLIE